MKPSRQLAEELVNKVAKTYCDSHDGKPSERIYLAELMNQEIAITAFIDLARAVDAWRDEHLAVRLSAMYRALSELKSKMPDL